MEELSSCMYCTTFPTVLTSYVTMTQLPKIIFLQNLLALCRFFYSSRYLIFSFSGPPPEYYITIRCSCFLSLHRPDSFCLNILDSFEECSGQIFCRISLNLVFFDVLLW